MNQLAPPGDREDGRECESLQEIQKVYRDQPGSAITPP